MVETGQLLRQAREAKELSLEDVEAKTRIRQRYLSALESGDWDDLPSPVAARGFLRTYATFLGLDSDEIAAKTQEVLNDNAGTSPSATPNSDYRPINLDIYYGSAKRSRWQKRALRLALILIPLLVAGYLFYQYGLPYLQTALIEKDIITATVAVELPPEGKAKAPVIAATNTAVPALPTQTSTSAPEPTATPTPTPTTQPSPTPASTNIIQLTVRATQTAWVRVVADGEVLVESLQDPGYEQHFSAKKRMEFLTGNAGGMQLELNGEVLPKLGEVGEISVFVWTIKDKEIIEITPTPLPTATPTPEPTATPIPG
jgi:cytoskeletal protein RodZ